MLPDSCVTMSLVEIDGVHQVPDHPVWVDRRLIGRQLGQPLLEPGFFDGADVVVQRLVRGAPGAACLLPELIQELALTPAWRHRPVGSDSGYLC